MKTRIVHQTRLVLIACLIAFGLPGSRLLPKGVAAIPKGYQLGLGIVLGVY